MRGVISSDVACWLGPNQRKTGPRNVKVNDSFFQGK